MSTWISVEDELPEERVEVLMSQHAYMDTSKPRYIQIGYHENEAWTVEPNDDDDDRQDVFSPSHWMSLPEPPQ